MGDSGAIYDDEMSISSTIVAPESLIPYAILPEGAGRANSRSATSSTYYAPCHVIWVAVSLRHTKFNVDVEVVNPLLQHHSPLR